MSAQLVKVLQRHLRRAIGNRQWEEAQGILMQLKEAAPLAIETRGLELDLLISCQRFDNAKALAEQLLQMFPSSPRIQFLNGQLHYRLKEYEKAEGHFREGDRLHPHWRNKHWLGKTLTQKGEFAEAEALLLALIAEHPRCHKDLAWLYERQEQIHQALKHLELYQQHFPEDEYAQAQIMRLRAESLDSGELIEDLENLLDFGETIPDELMPVYLQRLLESGQSAKARAIIADKGQNLSSRLATQLAWVSYKHHGYDLAMKLFVQALTDNLNNYKFLNALENASSRCHREDELIELYTEHAVIEKKLYGRINGLKRKIRKRAK